MIDETFGRGFILPLKVLTERKYKKRQTATRL